MFEYFFMIYTESSINECIIRFLADKEIEINLINKFDNSDVTIKIKYISLF